AHSGILRPSPWTLDDDDGFKFCQRAGKRVIRVSGPQPPDGRRKTSPVDLAIRVGDIAMAERRWAGAEVAYRYALERDPSLAQTWVQYGHAVKELGDLVRAEDAYRRAIDIDGSKADSHLQLGHVLKMQDRLGDARAAYRAALQQDPECESAAQELEALDQ